MIQSTSQETCRADTCSLPAVHAWYRHSHSIAEAEQYFPAQVFNDYTRRFSVSREFEEEGLGASAQTGTIPTQVIVCGPDNSCKIRIEDSFIRIITQAKESVYIQTPYFTPTEQFASALKIAACSGVDVRIMIPGKWDKFYMKAASMDFARYMSQYDVQFFIYPGFIQIGRAHV